MRVVLKLKPRILESHTKATLESKIKDSYSATWVSGAGYGLRTWVRGAIGDDHWVLVNYEKHRTKRTQIRLARSKRTKITGPDGSIITVNKKHMTTKTVPAFWRAFVYLIPTKLVKTCNQKARNFTVEFKPL